MSFQFCVFRLEFQQKKKQKNRICAGHADVRFHRQHVALSSEQSRGSAEEQAKIGKKNG